MHSMPEVCIKTIGETSFNAVPQKPTHRAIGVFVADAVNWKVTCGTATIVL